MQVLNVGIEQMPHGKLYDQPYLPELLGTVDACNPQAETSPDTSPSQRPPSQHQGNESRAAAQPSSATQGQPCSALVAVSQQVSQGGQTISTGAGTDLPVQHQGHDCSQSQQDQQQQSGPSSQVTLTQPDVTAAAAAEVTSVAQQAQHQGQQQDYPNQEHHQQYQQHQQQQQHQHRGSAADHGTVAMQVESTSVLQQARNGPQNTVAGASSGPSSPAKDNSRIGSADAGSQATWAPFADFDVYSILEVAPMKLLQDFYTDMAQVGLGWTCSTVEAVMVSGNFSKLWHAAAITQASVLTLCLFFATHSYIQCVYIC